MHGILFDLPPVVKFADSLLVDSPLRNRVRCVAGNFFDDPLPPSDLYALGRILHDWSAEKIDRLLIRIIDELPDGGGLLIAEKLLDDDRLGPVTVHMQSLNMLVVTEGRERSLPEYRELLTRAGFSSVEGVRTGQPLDAILALK
jgi:acetylserotonin N-methyltransferase